MRFTILALFWAITVGSTPFQVGALTPADFNGEWIPSEGQMAGTLLSDEQLSVVSVTHKDGKYVVVIGDTKSSGTFTVDGSKSPASMDASEEEGPNAGKTTFAIIEKTQSGWRACYALEGGARPTAFDGSGQRLLVSYKRKPGTEPPPSSKAIRALLITGGCCHEYEKQSVTLAEGLSKRANVIFTVVQDKDANGTQHRISAYQKENWSDGYDLVIHNECYADEKDPAWLERIVKPHREGLPAVAIHCAMHCYRAPTNEWFKFLGVTSYRHGSHFDYLMTNVKPEHPVMAGFPPLWRTPNEELYHIEKMEPTAIPLATGWSHETKRGEVNAWVNTYGKARVFGTTIGHYDKTMREPLFLDLVARGLLWACGKLDDQGKPVEGAGPTK